LFAAWLDSREGLADFERFCGDHPTIAAELRRLWRGLVRYADLRDRTVRLLRPAPLMRSHAARR
jgi:hypothetical protein